MSEKASRQASLQVYPSWQIIVTTWNSKIKLKTLKCWRKASRAPKISSFKVGSKNANKYLKLIFLHLWNKTRVVTLATNNIIISGMKISTLALQQNIESPEESYDGVVSNSNDFSNSMSNRFDQMVFGNSNSRNSKAPLFSTFFKQFACRPPQLCVSTHAKTPIWLQSHFSS